MVFSIENQSNQESIFPPGSLINQDLLLQNLSNSTIHIFNPNHSAKLINCTKSKFIISALSGGIQIISTEDCTISSASSEVTIENSKNLKLFIFTETEPAIKLSSNLKFAPFNIKFSGQDSCFAEAELNCYKDKWSEVHDLSRNDSMPHYELLNPKDFIEETFEFPDSGEPLNPVPRHTHYGGSLNYELISYSKTHNYTKEKKDLPPTSKIIHSENDRRKNIPWSRPLTVVEVMTDAKVTVEADAEADVDAEGNKGDVKVLYCKGKGFDLVKCGVSEEVRERAGKELKEICQVLDEYVGEVQEIVLAGLASFVGMFFCLLVMEVLRMSSEWVDASVACVIILLITSEFLIGLVCLRGWRKVRKHFEMLVIEFNQRKKIKIKEFSLEGVVITL